MKPRYPTTTRYRRRSHKNRNRRTGTAPSGGGLRSPGLLVLAVMGALAASYLYRDQPPAVVESAFQEPLTPMVEQDAVGLLPDLEDQQQVNDAALTQVPVAPLPESSEARMTTFEAADVPVVLSNATGPNEKKKTKRARHKDDDDLGLTFYKSLAKKKIEVMPRKDREETQIENDNRPRMVVGNEIFSAQGVSLHPRGWSTTRSVIVQLAAFEEMNSAYALASNLRMEGAPVRIMQLDRNEEEQQQRQFRVQLGPFETRADAAKAAVFWRVEGRPALIM
ncbi:MAG: SPOR domain-containing protein [Magnetococcales bacterium]|nr:SPOR domain-containing protein [Magnetococcales bacterium]